MSNQYYLLLCVVLAIIGISGVIFFNTDLKECKKNTNSSTTKRPYIPPKYRDNRPYLMDKEIVNPDEPFYWSDNEYRELQNN